ncbi:MAG: UDP-N-acetylmuramoyl-tripeptide--D-alanyl-D-alanine ligase [Cytophagales bacterium]|jgi:UDP-N-acetylmuramoyl-tripeptide--D-alanyl-D-alanine ligase|nr:UDP-N-acetylmuramoyl-tripeptide--D-alanyl-D-alanine ligase [Cytophagales bacterium]
MSRIFSLPELLQNLKALDYNCPDEISFDGTNINSKKIQSGNIFFAIKGNKVDGHDFVKNAFDNGAKICIIDHFTPTIVGNKFPYILVENVRENLFVLAKYCRKTFKGKIIALTGSAGKSTTKNWLFEILKNFKKTFSTYKNQNTDIGSALTLTNCEQDVEFCVMELGMSTRGEISASSKLIEPNIALILNIKPVHIENFNSLLEIAQEKSDIVDGLKKNSAIFVNREETPFEKIVEYINSKNKNVKIFSFGKNENCDCLLKSFQLQDENIFVNASILGNDIDFFLQNVGEQFISSTLAILGIAKYLDLFEQEVVKKLNDLHLYPGAGEISEIKTSQGKIKIIDETHNANPASVIWAIKKLSAIEGKRKIAVLGAMYELGDYLQQGLDEVLKSLLENKIDLVFTCGKEIKYLFDKLPAKIQGKHCDEVETKILDDVVNGGDIFLVKGSHGVNLKKGRMYGFVEKLCSFAS